MNDKKNKNNVIEKRVRLNQKMAEIRPILIDVFVIMVPLMLLWIVELFFVGVNYGYWLPSIRVKGLLIECIIIYSVCLMLFGIVKKWKTVIMITGISLALLGVVNQIKFAFTGEPVLLSDFLFLNSTGDLVQIIQGDFWRIVSWYIPPLLIEIMLIALLAWGGVVLSGKFEINSKKIRICLASVSMLVIVLLMTPIQPINKIVLDVFYGESDSDDYNVSFTENVDYYYAYGFIGGIYNRFLKDRVIEPDGYAEEEVLSELDNAKGSKSSALGKPNIVVVFSESFWDVAKLKDVEFNREVTANFNKLKREGLAFDMITPSYGGVSANVEYEFLTGNNVMYYNRGFIPYMQLYNNSSYYDRPSIISELKENGYKTKIVTGASSDLFACGRFYDYLKVDEVDYVTEVEEDEIAGLYASDEYFTDMIIDYLENKDREERVFYMSLTMESHMPYFLKKYDSYDVNVTRSEYSDDVNDTLTAYAQGIYDADVQLGRLYEYIKKFEEPTIIVFFGDHLPYLYSGKDNAINLISYFNTDDNVLNNYRKYNTESLVLTNFDLGTVDMKAPDYLGPDMLGAFVLNNMDIEISDYYKWLYDSIETMPTANYVVGVDGEGKLFDTHKLSGNLEKVYNMRRNIEYKLFVR